MNPSPFMDLAYFVSLSFFEGQIVHLFSAVPVAQSTPRVLSTQDGNEDAVSISCQSEGRNSRFDLGFGIGRRDSHV